MSGPTPLVKHNLWGAIIFGLCTKYVKYQCLWHSEKIRHVVNRMACILKKKHSRAPTSTTANAQFQYLNHISRNMDYHYEAKTVTRLSYFHNGNSNTGKMASLYWNVPQGPALLTHRKWSISMQIYGCNYSSMHLTLNVRGPLLSQFN